MKIKLAEAAHDEKGALGYGGSVPGDQTGDEVRIRDYSNGGSGWTWKYVIRCKDANCARAISIRNRQCAENDAIGYSQVNRLSLVEALKKDPDPSHIKSSKVECDCSSMQSAIAMVTIQSIGVKTSLTGHEYTGIMYERFMSDISGMWSDVTKSVNLSTGYGLKDGDILLTPGKHTACVVSVEEEKAITHGVVKTILCLRDAPINGKILKYMRTGSNVEILGETIASNGAKWYRASYQGVVGWCSAKYVVTP